MLKSPTACRPSFSGGTRTLILITMSETHGDNNEPKTTPKELNISYGIKLNASYQNQIYFSESHSTPAGIGFSVELSPDCIRGYSN